MASLVYLTSRAPSKLANDLMLAGYRVFEALEVSEVLHLYETQDVDVIVIGGDVEDPDLIEAQMRRLTIKLNPQATVKELIWELSKLLPDRAPRIQ